MSLAGRGALLPAGVPRFNLPRLIPKTHEDVASGAVAVSSFVGKFNQRSLRPPGIPDEGCLPLCVGVANCQPGCNPPRCKGVRACLQGTRLRRAPRACVYAVAGELFMLKALLVFERPSAPGMGARGAKRLRWGRILEVGVLGSCLCMRCMQKASHHHQ